MIVPMRKVAVIVQDKDAQLAVERLRGLGVLHVEHQQVPQGRDISALRDDIALVEEAVKILSSEEFRGQGQGPGQALSEWRFVARHILDVQNRIVQLQEYSRRLMNTLSEWEGWGDFDPAAIQELARKGVYLRLYQISLREINKLPAEVILEKISERRGMVNCAVISRRLIDIAFKEIVPPKVGLSKMRSRLSEDSRVIVALKEDLRQHYSGYKADFIRLKKSWEKELEFYEALKGMGQVGQVSYLVGYIPEDAEALLVKTAQEEKLGLQTSEPSDEDRVPTLIRNPRWVSIIAPVFRFVEIIPGYHELDISLWFLVFFSVFFGMLIGDAGYGLVFFLLTLLAQRRWGKRLGNKAVFILFYLLSSCAMIWGVFSGTFFGQDWLPQSVKPLIPALRNDKNVQELCFFLGAVHLSIAHLWRSLIKFPALSALADLGWVFILWGAFWLANTLILGAAFSSFGKWFFIAGPLLGILFTSPRKNILKGIGLGLGAFALSAVNSFTDVVSYIRLFAVGLATVAIADAFNAMAMSVGYGNVLTGVLTAVILILGHLLNIMLGPLAVLVHGVRLNVLEFCNHVDIKWSGFAYRPLEKDKSAVMS